MSQIFRFSVGTATVSALEIDCDVVSHLWGRRRAWFPELNQISLGTLQLLQLPLDLCLKLRGFLGCFGQPFDRRLIPLQDVPPHPQHIQPVAHHLDVSAKAVAILKQFHATQLVGDFYLPSIHRLDLERRAQAPQDLCIEAVPSGLGGLVQGLMQRRRHPKRCAYVVVLGHAQNSSARLQNEVDTKMKPNYIASTASL